MRPFQTIAQIIIATSVVNCAPVPAEIINLSAPENPIHVHFPPVTRPPVTHPPVTRPSVQDMEMRPLHGARPAAADNPVTPKNKTGISKLWALPVGAAVGIGTVELVKTTATHNSTSSTPSNSTSSAPSNSTSSTPSNSTSSAPSNSTSSAPSNSTHQVIRKRCNFAPSC